MILYLDCIGGAAGDMLLASLIDAGASIDAVNIELSKLGVSGLVARATRTVRHSIDCCHIDISWDRSDDHNDHSDRSYADIQMMIGSAGLGARVEHRALSAFRALAEAEATIHGISIDNVHFHEVGSEDSIADVVGVCIALELLNIDEVISSPLPVGRGFVRTAHGLLPLPAPATLQLLRGVPIEGVDIEKELVTPTGAALIVSLSSSFGTVPSMQVSSIGYGAGTRDLPQRPNVVRSMIGEMTTQSTTKHWAPGRVVVIETNLDDCSPELIPDAALAANNAGALDVWTTSAGMKKGRPGFVLHALARPEQAQAVATAILRETSAIGVRMAEYDRLELDRSFLKVLVETETVSVKIGKLDDEVLNIAPEHDDCAAVAKTLGLSVKEVFARALVAAHAAL